MSTRTPLARRVIATLLLVLLTACHSWRPTAVSPQTLIPAERPSSVRTTLRSGARVTLENPTVRNDSIVVATDPHVGVALRDVRLLEVQSGEVRQTGLPAVLVFASEDDLFSVVIDFNDRLEDRSDAELQRLLDEGRGGS